MLAPRFATGFVVRAGLLILLTFPIGPLARPAIYAEAAPPARAAAASPALRGLYRQHCVKCHGADGKGTTARGLFPEIPDFTRGTWQKGHSDAQLLASILDGKGTAMPSLAGKVNKSQARDLVKYIRTFAPAVKKARQDREATPDRDSFDVRYRSLGKELSELQRQFHELSKASSDDVPSQPVTADPAKAEQDEDLEETPAAYPTAEKSEAPAPPEPEEAGTPAGPPAGFFEKLTGWLGKLHPATVHFPIAMLTAAAVAELLRLLTGQPVFDAITRYCLWFGALTAVAAGVLGWFLGEFQLIDASWLLTTHRWLGTATLASAVLLLGLSEWRRRPEGRHSRIWFRAALFVVTGLVLATGFFGGAVVYGLDHYTWQQ